MSKVKTKQKVRKKLNKKLHSKFVLSYTHAFKLIMMTNQFK